MPPVFARLRQAPDRVRADRAVRHTLGDMQPRVRSVNVGGARGGILPRGRETAIDKRPVAAIQVRDPGPKRGGLGSGVVGDDVVSRKHHGGSRQAVYAVAREELDWWGATLGRELVDGMFGENLTTAGARRRRLGGGGALAGRVGAARGDRAAHPVRDVPGVDGGAAAGCAGSPSGGAPAPTCPWSSAGLVSTGDAVEVLGRPAHGITVPEVFRAFTGDDELAARVLQADILGGDDRPWLERRVARRR